jgi:hypothetical protein
MRSNASYQYEGAMGIKACMVKKIGEIEAPHNDLLNA